MGAVGGLVKKLREQVLVTRRDLHRIPETGFHEAKTSRYVADCLKRLGLEVQTGIATHGVVGLLRTGQPGPTLMIRADMDALPIAEETGLAFASTHAGVMHACGHDANMSMALGAAAVLTQLKGQFKGNVKFIFQPAEEGPGGALPMIAAGVMENPTVDYAIGCHLWAERPEGYIGSRTGACMAAMDRFDLKIIGKGGHGAQPHLCVDALEVGTQVVASTPAHRQPAHEPHRAGGGYGGHLPLRDRFQYHPRRSGAERHHPHLRRADLEVLGGAHRQGGARRLLVHGGRL